jgi:hypothetical protein
MGQPLGHPAELFSGEVCYVSSALSVKASVEAFNSLIILSHGLAPLPEDSQCHASGNRLSQFRRLQAEPRKQCGFGRQCSCGCTFLAWWMGNFRVEWVQTWMTTPIAEALSTDFDGVHGPEASAVCGHSGPGEVRLSGPFQRYNAPAARGCLGSFVLHTDFRSTSRFPEGHPDVPKSIPTRHAS